jgi:starch synthase (maltosyl-transferring)
VLYLPPIHPIGTLHRKGPNNALWAGPDDPGSPWAVGSAEGGHDAIHPALGTLEDFEALRVAALDHGLELALDIAFQAAPDHPWVREHPQWFRHRPDGTIQPAENPPKLYQDIYPLDFESERWPELWEALARVFEVWIERGVSIFRVDNPHTKSMRFWEWCIARIKARHPEVILLSEAFTRPRRMERLAKLGFSQSYTYFTWRNTAAELRQYFEQLTRPPLAEYLRPNLWPATPDILPELLQHGGRPAFVIRLVLAATLGASYGIYGPAYELCEHRAIREGSEEYLDSEKYQLRRWDLGAERSLHDLVARLNQIRREHPALQQDHTLRFCETDNDRVLCFLKTDPPTGDAIVVVVSLDPHHAQAGWIHLPLHELVGSGEPVQMHDLLSEDRHLWSGSAHYVRLDPRALPAHVLRPRRRLRTEHDFDYFG